MAVIMDCLGCVETVSGEGRFVVKAVTAPDMNDVVFDSEGKRMGTVKRIFGPVEGPYVTINADKDVSLADLVGKKIYRKGEIKNAKGKRKH